MVLEKEQLKRFLSNNKEYTDEMILEAYADITETQGCGPALGALKAKINSDLTGHLPQPINADEFVYWNEHGQDKLLITVVLEEVQTRQLRKSPLWKQYVHVTDENTPVF